MILPTQQKYHQLDFNMTNSIMISPTQQKYHQLDFDITNSLTNSGVPDPANKTIVGESFGETGGGRSSGQPFVLSAFPKFFFSIFSFGLLWHRDPQPIFLICLLYLWHPKLYIEASNCCPACQKKMSRDGPFVSIFNIRYIIYQDKFYLHVHRL